MNVIINSYSVHMNDIYFNHKQFIKERDQLNQYSKVLLRFSALFALVGVFLGSHMAGSGGYQFLTVHAHILVVGWLSLFAFAVFYKVFKPAQTILRSEEHTSELQSRGHLVCRLLLEKKKLSTKKPRI